MPVLVCRGRGGQARALMAEAQRLAIPLAEEAELARALAVRTAPGRPIPEATFHPVAQALARSGAA